MNNTWGKDYPTVVDLDEDKLDENISLKKMLRLVGYNKRVLDLGCATGYFAKLLNKRGCQVIGLEVNAKAASVAEEYCEKVFVADLDFVLLSELLGEEKFDVVVFGDILEHLRNPWQILEETRELLKPDAYIVASIPNIAHGAIRLALLQGKFEYSDFGILDNTHLRFFTKDTVEELFEKTGYLVSAIERTKLPVFSGHNLLPQINQQEFNNNILSLIDQDQESETLQFIIQAFPVTLERQYFVFKERCLKLQEKLEQAQSRIQQSDEEAEQAKLNFQSQLQQQQTEFLEAQSQLQSQLQQIQIQLQQQQTELTEVHLQLQHAQTQTQQQQTEFAEAQSQLESLLQQTQTQLQQKQTEFIEAQFQLQQANLQEKQTEFLKAQSQLQQTHLQQKQTEFLEVQSQLQQTQTELLHLRTTIKAMETSKFWQVRAIWFKFRRVIGLTEDDRPLQRSLLSQVKHFWSILKKKGLSYSANKLVEKASPKLSSILVPTVALVDIPQSDNVNYQKWLNKYYPSSAVLRKIAETIEIFALKPVISLVMPVYNTPELYLREAIDSVINQVYPYWQLCIADDASTDNKIREVLEEYSAKDSRINVVFRTENGHISRCSNSALEITTGEFVALLDHDDLLTPDALYEVALLINRHPEADMIYSDEDKIDDTGKLKDPFFKPDWCPDTFMSRMYTCHLGVYRRELVNLIGGFREGYEGSQDYDLVLRLTEKTTNIFHIPKVLYHWRIHPESAAYRPDQKPYAVIAATKAITDALVRRGEEGEVIASDFGHSHYMVRYKIVDYKLVSIIIPTRDLGDVLDKCLTSIFEKSIYPNYEVVLIDNGSREEYTAKVIAKWQEKEPNRFKCYPLDIPFNYSAINNYAVQQAQGDFLLFLNNDIEVITPDWIDAMVEQVQRPSIGAVGALLLYPDDTIQHAGVVIGIGGVAGHSHKYYSVNSSGYFNQLLTINNYSAVTAACLMCKRDVFKDVGGFEEKLSVAFNDVDLCLKIVTKGYRNIYLPHVKLYHYESKSRGYESTPEKQARFNKEIEYMQSKWKEFIENDPCYSPNLTKVHEDYSIKI